MSESEKDHGEAQKPFEFNWKSSGDDKPGEGLQAGLAAFGKMLEGIVQMAGSLGGDAVRNGLGANWLNVVATSLEETVKTVLDTGKSPGGRIGEVDCFLERLDAELKGTKFEFQADGFRQRLQEASQLFERMHSPAAGTSIQEEISQLSDVAGYFRGAAGPRQT